MVLEVLHMLLYLSFFLSEINNTHSNGNAPASQAQDEELVLIWFDGTIGPKHAIWSCESCAVHRNGISKSIKDWAGDLKLIFQLIARGCFQGFVKKLRNSWSCCMCEIRWSRVQNCSILRWTTTPILDVWVLGGGSTIVDMWQAPKGGPDPSAMQVSAVASAEDHVHLATTFGLHEGMLGSFH